MVISTWAAVFFFLLVALIAVNHTLALPYLSQASLHAICPFGGVETLFSLISTGLTIPKVHLSSVVLLIIVLVLSLFIGPVFCGWICPLGSLQEAIRFFGKKHLKTKRLSLLSLNVEKKLGSLRYLILILLLWMTARSAQLLFVNIDPFHALFQFWTGEVAMGAFIILGITMILSLVMDRPWCKIACPFGALLGIFNKIRLFPVRRTESLCIQCGACNKACPMKIDVQHSNVLRDNRCISCLECTSEKACPIPPTVDVTLRGRS